MKYVSQPALTKHLPDTAPGKENVTNCSKVLCFVLVCFRQFRISAECGQQIPVECSTEKLTMLIETRKPLYDYCLEDPSN